MKFHMYEDINQLHIYTYNYEILYNYNFLTLNITIDCVLGCNIIRERLERSELNKNLFLINIVVNTLHFRYFICKLSNLRSTFWIFFFFHRKNINKLECRDI